RRRKGRKVPALKIQLNGARISDLLAALHGVGVRRKKSVHFRRRAQVELIAPIAQPVLIPAGLAGIDAQQHVMGGAVDLAEIVGVAGGDQRQSEPVGNVDRTVGAALLKLQAVVLDFDVEVVAELPSEPLGQSGRFLKLILEDEFTKFAGGAAAQTDN